jgi:hypothetical protein
VQMGRPSLFEASAVAEGGEVRSFEVGGASTLIAQGSIDVAVDDVER